RVPAAVSEAEARRRIITQFVRKTNEKTGRVLILSPTFPPVLTGGCDAPAGQLNCGSYISNGFLGGSDCLLPEVNMYADIYDLGTFASGQRVTLTATSTSPYEVFVAFQDFDEGTILASDYAVGSVTVTYDVLATDRYAVSLTLLEPYTTGNYTLRMTCETITAGECDWTGSVACGTKNMVGSIAPGGCSDGEGRNADVYSMLVEGGQTIEMSVSADFDLFITLAMQDGNDWYHSGVWRYPGRIGSVTYTVPHDGWLEVWVSSQDRNVTGGYSLGINCLSSGSPCKRRAVGR
ncbi:MAG TPA: hypothetical protein VFQ06_10785, partial [Nitrospira sp.]|nr:hypothetical protein [Nitrospira sp.]